MRRFAGATGVMWSLHWLAGGLTRRVARRDRPRFGVAGQKFLLPRRIFDASSGPETGHRLFASGGQ
jgi:hypothetical protein